MASVAIVSTYRSILLYFCPVGVNTFHHCWWNVGSLSCVICCAVWSQRTRLVSVSPRVSAWNCWSLD